MPETPPSPEPFSYSPEELALFHEVEQTLAPRSLDGCLFFIRERVADIVQSYDDEIFETQNDITDTFIDTSERVQRELYVSNRLRRGDLLIVHGTASISIQGLGMIDDQPAITVGDITLDDTTHIEGTFTDVLVTEPPEVIVARDAAWEDAISAGHAPGHQKLAAYTTDLCLTNIKVWRAGEVQVEYDSAFYLYLPVAGDTLSMARIALT